MAEIPIEIDGNVPSESYYLEPDPNLDAPVMVARSVGWTDSLDIVVQVMNPSDLPIVLEPGQPIAVLHPTTEINSHMSRPSAVVNNVDQFHDH